MNVNSPVQKVCVAATGLVTGSSGAATGAKGCAVAQTGTGVYTLTKGATDPWPAAVNMDVKSTASGAFWPTFVRTSDTVVTVTTRDAAGAAANADFTMSIDRIEG